MRLSRVWPRRPATPALLTTATRRFVQMFADVVMMVPKSLFEVEIDKMKAEKGYKTDADLTAET